MSNRDGTGPEGEGPLTGRGMGDCTEENQKRNQKDSDEE